MFEYEELENLTAAGNTSNLNENYPSLSEGFGDQLLIWTELVSLVPQRAVKAQHLNKNSAYSTNDDDKDVPYPILRKFAAYRLPTYIYIYIYL